MWVIQDWTGARKFPDRVFGSFQDGVGFLVGEFEDDVERGEFFVVRM
jgi:hypothetical protein